MRNDIKRTMDQEVLDILYDNGLSIARGINERPYLFVRDSETQDVKRVVDLPGEEEEWLPGRIIRAADAFDPYAHLADMAYDNLYWGISTTDVYDQAARLDKAADTLAEKYAMDRDPKYRDSLDINVKSWYIEAFPADPHGEAIYDKMTFRDLYNDPEFGDANDRFSNVLKASIIARNDKARGAFEKAQKMIDNKIASLSEELGVDPGIRALERNGFTVRPNKDGELDVYYENDKFGLPHGSLPIAEKVVIAANKTPNVNRGVELGKDATKALSSAADWLSENIGIDRGVGSRDGGPKRFDGITLDHFSYINHDTATFRITQIPKGLDAAGHYAARRAGMIDIVPDYTLKIDPYTRDVSLQGIARKFEGSAYEHFDIELNDEEKKKLFEQSAQTVLKQFSSRPYSATHEEFLVDLKNVGYGVVIPELTDQQTNEKALYILDNKSDFDIEAHGKDAFLFSRAYPEPVFDDEGYQKTAGGGADISLSFDMTERNSLATAIIKAANTYNPERWMASNAVFYKEFSERALKADSKWFGMDLNDLADTLAHTFGVDRDYGKDVDVSQDPWNVYGLDVDKIDSPITPRALFTQIEGEPTKPFSSYCITGASTEAIIEALNKIDPNMVVANGQKSPGYLDPAKFTTSFDIFEQQPELIYQMTDMLHAEGWAHDLANKPVTEAKCIAAVNGMDDPRMNTDDIQKLKGGIASYRKTFGMAMYKEPVEEKPSLGVNDIKKQHQEATKQKKTVSQKRTIAD